MSIGAFTLLLLLGELSQCESACMCPASNPGCESDGKCYKRSHNSWSWKGLSCGKCTSSHSSNELEKSALHKGKCFSYYGGSGEWCYTKNKDGTFATSGCSSYDGYGTEWCCPNKYRCEEKSAASATSTGKLRDSGKGTTGKCYSYYGSKEKEEWCYTKKKDGDFATSGCGSYDGYETDKWCCPEKYSCKASGGSSAGSSGGSSGGCNPSALGQFIADFVKGKKGTKVYSDKQGSAQCWDLAWGALEQAAKAGHNPVFYQKESHWKDAYAWSSEIVPIEDAQPGDIAQFKGWKEPYLMAWNPHTAVVTECYKDGALTTYQQNPSPISKGVYHPHEKSSGSVTIYRPKSSRLRLYSQTPQLSVLSLHSGQFSTIALGCAVAGFFALAAFIVKRKRTERTLVQNAQPTIEDAELLLPCENPEE